MLAFSDDEKSCLVSKRKGDVEKQPLLRQRSTIFAEETLYELERATSKQVVEVVTTTPAGIIIQMVLFFMLCLVIGLTPFFTQLLIRDPVTGKKSLTFLPQTPYLVDFCLTVILSNIISLILYGTRGLKACWNLHSIWRLSPASLLYGTTTSLEFLSMVYLDSALRTILNQLKLPLSAVFYRIVQGTKQSLLQWTIIIAITTSVSGFIGSSLKGQTTEMIRNIAGKGVVIAVVAVACSFGAQWFTDITTKQMDEHLIIQMSQMRITTSLVVLGHTLGWAVWRSELYKFPFHGWTRNVFALSCFLILKDLLTVYVLKRLDFIWLGVATSCGLGVSYIVDILFLDKRFDVSCFFFVLVVSILVVSWGAAKKT